MVWILDCGALYKWLILSSNHVTDPHNRNHVKFGVEKSVSLA